MSAVCYKTNENFSVAKPISRPLKFVAHAADPSPLSCLLYVTHPLSGAPLYARCLCPRLHAPSPSCAVSSPPSLLFSADVSYPKGSWLADWWLTDSRSDGSCACDCSNEKPVQSDPFWLTSLASLASPTLLVSSCLVVVSALLGAVALPGASTSNVLF